MLSSLRRLLRSCLKCVQWGVSLTLVIALVGSVLIYLHINDQIRSHLQKKLAEHYRQFRVRVRAARIVQGKGIEIRGLSLTLRGEAGAAGPMVDIDEILVVCDPNMPDLVQDQLQVEKILIRRPRFRAARGKDGSWDVAGLVPLPNLSDSSPEAIIQNGIVQIVDATKSAASSLTLREVNLQIHAQQAGAAPGTPSDPQASLKFQGSLRGQHVKRAEFAGSLNPDGGDWRFQGSIEGLGLSPELLAALPDVLPTEARQLETLRAQARIRFDISSNRRQSPQLQYQADCEVWRGQLAHPRLPLPLTDLHAKLRVTTGLITLEQLTARHGETTLSLSGEQAGLEPGSPLTLTAEIRRLKLQRELVEGRHEQAIELWDQYQPTGTADVDVKLAYDGVHWQPEITVRCEELTLTYYKFPVRLTDGAGWISYRDDRLLADLTAHLGDRPIRIYADILQPGPQATGAIELRGSEIPVDEKLVAALPEGPREFTRSLNASGSFQFYWRTWRDDPRVADPHHHMALNFNECAMKFDKFAYPLSKIRGTVEMLDDRWSFRGLEGENDTGRVLCNGEIVPEKEGQDNVLRLTFEAESVPLEAELKNALKPDAQQVWEHLNPRGQIDLTAHLTYPFAGTQPELTVNVRPAGENTSLEPDFFPYSIEKLSGSATFREGGVVVEELRGQHGRTRIATRGQAATQPDGSWYFALHDLYVDRLKADHDLLVALPAGLRSVVGRLSPTGPINMRGWISLAKAAEEDAPLTSRWDLSFNVHRSSINCGLPLTNVYGDVRLRGQYDGEQFTSQGELAIDSLTYQNIQFTDVRGPLWFNNQWALLGARAEQAQRRAEEENGRLPRSGRPGTGNAPRFREAATGGFASTSASASGLQRAARRDNGTAVGPRNGVVARTPPLQPAPNAGGRSNHPAARSERLPRRITAKLYGGTLVGDGWVLLGERPQYGVQASLADADLERFGRESLTGRKKLTGKVLATVQLQGAAPSIYSLSGSGQVRLQDADIYELPLMVQLLKVLRAKPPDATAFTAANMDFRLQGPHILLDRINFLGDAVSFYGKGEVGFNREVNLTFHSVVGRNELPLPLLQKFVGEASEQIMQIQVRGTLDEPQTTSQIFPAVNEVLERLQQDLQLPQDRRKPSLQANPRDWLKQPAAARRSY